MEITRVTMSLEDAMSTLGALLQAHSESAGHPWAPEPVHLVARDGQTTLGGLSGQIVYDWFWIMLLAVDPEARGRGVGRALIAEAEDVARRAGALGLHVDTFAFQAPGFYTGLGFEEITRLPGRVPAEDRVFLKKHLDPAPQSTA